jgi:hypothetical protein
MKVATELSHEGLAESTNLSVTLSFRVKVRPTLATSHWKSSQGILENLLKAKEFQDPVVNSWMKAKTTLVRTQDTIKRRDRTKHVVLI